MKFKTLTGKLKDIPVHKHLIDWSGDSLSHFQEDVKDFMYPYWKHDVVCEELPVAGTKMRLDIINLTRRIIIEVNGIAHLDPQSHFHNGSRINWLNQVKRDMAKHRWAEINGYKLVEIEPEDMPLTKSFFKERYDIDL